MSDKYYPMTEVELLWGDALKRNILKSRFLRKKQEEREKEKEKLWAITDVMRGIK